MRQLCTGILDAILADPLVRPFVDWLDSLGLDPNHLYGWPDGEPDWTKLPAGGCPARCWAE